MGASSSSGRTHPGDTPATAEAILLRRCSKARAALLAGDWQRATEKAHNVLRVCCAWDGCDPAIFPVPV